MTTSSSWITYYFKSQYHIEEGKLGSIFFTTSIIAAGSVLVASSLARRIGNVRVSAPQFTVFQSLVTNELP
jgi:MFS-type transporter involved in bile tolerance (Atg22 family)